MKFHPIFLIPPFTILLIFGILFCCNEHSKNKKRGYRSPLQ